MVKYSGKSKGLFETNKLRKRFYAKNSCDRLKIHEVCLYWHFSRCEDMQPDHKQLIPLHEYSSETVLRVNKNGLPYAGRPF